jgi:protein-tyrosine phosphatase
VLFVCTAGRCRSPIAAALLQFHADGAHPTIRAQSAGLMVSGEPMPNEGVSLMAARGIDLRQHTSLQVTEGLIEQADLVLGMARRHVRELVAIAPDHWSKAFIFKDFVQRSEKAGSRGRHQRLADWLESVGAGRDRRELLADRPDDDVPDPMGKRIKVWRRTIADIDHLTLRTAQLLTGL